MRLNVLVLGFVICLGLAASFGPQCGSVGEAPAVAKLPSSAGEGTVARSKYTLLLTIDEAGVTVDAIDPYDERRQTAHVSGPWDPALLWYIEGADGTTLASGMIEDPRTATERASFMLDVPVNTGTIKIYELAPSAWRWWM